MAETTDADTATPLAPKWGPDMDIHMHPGVKKVLEFMQRNLPTDQLCGVATGVAGLAPILWGHYVVREVRPLALNAPPIR